MRFQGTRGGTPLDFRQAVSLGYPGDGGYFVPEALFEGSANLRSAVYAPLAGFAEVVALAASELLPEVLDPRHLVDIVLESYASEPPLHQVDKDILVLDMATGASSSSADYAAAFEARLLGRLAEPGKDFVLAATSSFRDAAALGAAFAAKGTGLPLVLLCPEGQEGGLAATLAGGRASPVLVLEVEGGPAAAAALERNLAGHSLAGRRVMAGGAASPSRLVGRSLLLIGLFSIARRGLSGDLIVTAPPGDLLGLVTGLWAWSWGLPVSAFLLPDLEGDVRHEGECLAAGPEWADASGEPDSLAGAEMLRSFGRDRPLGSLVLRMPLPPGSRGEVLVDGLSLDKGSGLALEAARAALAGGLAGHGTIVVPRFAGPVPVPPAAPARSSRPCPLIEAKPGALEAAISAFLGQA